MANIFDLEINNLSKKEEKYWIKRFKIYNDDEFEKAKKWVNSNESIKKPRDLWEKQKKVLKKFFSDNPKFFIDFQKSHKNSLYNQVIKENNFKDLTYIDMIRNLSQGQTNKIVGDIQKQAKYWKLGCEKDCDNYYNDNSSYIKLADEFDKKEYGNYKYIYVHYFSNKVDRGMVFIDDDNDLIHEALNRRVTNYTLFRDYNEILNPHHKVNQWIVKNHELERLKKDSQEQKDNLEQSQKFEAPKLKMKM